MMKLIVSLAAALISCLSVQSQFKDLVIVKVDNNDIVPGTTYQFYAQLTDNGDHIHIIFGDENNTLSIESTAPFYQNDLAGPLSTNINPKIDSLDKTVKYDSYFTIGRTNAKDNKLSNFNIDFTDFEERGTNIITDNGAWYVTPDQPQAFVENDVPFIMIMQLTTKGEITGNLNMQGKDKTEELWRSLDYKFSSNDAISQKQFKKMKKSIKKAFQSK